LGQAVGDFIFGCNFVVGEWVGESDRVTGHDGGEGNAWEKIGRFTPLKAGIRHGEIDAEGVGEDELGSRGAVMAGERVEQGAFDECHTEEGEERLELLFPAPAQLALIEFLPVSEKGRRLDLAGEFDRLTDYEEKFVDLLFEGLVRILGEPFGKEMIGRGPPDTLAMDAGCHGEKGVFDPGEGGDAEAERHAGGEIDGVQLGVLESEHGLGAGAVPFSTLCLSAMKARLSTFWEACRASYWFVPAWMALAAWALAELAVGGDRWMDGNDAELPAWVYAGGPESARTVLSTIVAAMMSVTSVVFSITIVVLTLASNQFGPRLLRNFMRDRGSQWTLGIFIATFVYTLLLLRTVREQMPVFVPDIGVSLAIGLTLLSVGVLIFFIHHIATSIQAESIIGGVDHELRQTMDRLCPEEAPDGEEKQSDADWPEDLDATGYSLELENGNYLQGIDYEALLSLAREHGLRIHFLKRPGAFVASGETIARVAPADAVDDLLRQRLKLCVVTGARRTPTQDIEFGILQFVEVAVRALSPGVNDPFTAIACIDRLGSAMRRLVPRPLPGAWRLDEEGVCRLQLATTDFEGHLDAAFNQIRQNAGGSAAVLARLMEALVTIAEAARDASRQDALRRQGDMVLEEAKRTLPEPRDRESIEARHALLRQRLDKEAES